jgi:hypothetical protein
LLAPYGTVFYGGYQTDYRDYYVAFYAAKQDCAIQFESFDWETGSYITPDGYEELCPDLAPFGDSLEPGLSAAWILLQGR